MLGLTFERQHIILRVSALTLSSMPTTACAQLMSARLMPSLYIQRIVWETSGMDLMSVVGLPVTILDTC